MTRPRLLVLLVVLVLGWILWPADPVTSQETEVCDLLVHGGTVVPMAADGPEIVRPGAVACRGSEIVAVGREEEILARFEAAETIDAEGGVILPGLVNGHTHVPMTLLRPITGELPVMEWLERFIFPAEARFVDHAFVRRGTRWGCVELCRAGTTTFVDMYYHEADVAEATSEVGLRAILGETILGEASPDAETPEEALAYTERFIEEWADDPLVTPAVAPHAPYTVPEETYRAAWELAERHDVPFLTHLAESEGEEAFCVETHGETPITLLDGWGVLGSRTIAAHVVWPHPEEIDLLAERGVGVVHNPKSNLRGGNGVAPLPELLEAGVDLGLGTDGPCGPNNLDLFENMDAAAIVQKGVANDWSAVRARDVVRMATIDGARAIGMADRIGSLEAGKEADLIVIGLDAPHLVPGPLDESDFSSIYQHIAYGVRGSDVRSTVVAGEVVMRDRDVVGVDEEALRGRVEETWREVDAFLRDR